jgi:hypothetical protein
MEKTPFIPSNKQVPNHSDTHRDKNGRKAIDEGGEQIVSKPGGFANDPDDPTNPNEAIERHRSKLR